MTSIDLNADLGESFGSWTLGDDASLLPLITSANVACGFHAGDPRTLRKTLALATSRGAVIGAQVSYPDLVGFGRRRMDVAADELTADVLYQISALDGLSQVAGSRVRYVKPHGALYHRTLEDTVQANAVVEAVVEYGRATGQDVAVMSMRGLALDLAAQGAGLRTISEGFADRAYDAGGRLVPRTQLGAVHHDLKTVVAQAVSLASSGAVRSICLHGDTPGAVDFARGVREGLEKAGIDVAPFA